VGDSRSAGRLQGNGLFNQSGETAHGRTDLFSPGTSTRHSAGWTSWSTKPELPRSVHRGFAVDQASYLNDRETFAR
jgi:hypothetical protein